MFQASENTKANKLHGIVELDETYFPRSQKGNHHLERVPINEVGGQQEDSH